MPHAARRIAAEAEARLARDHHAQTDVAVAIVRFGRARACLLVRRALLRIFARTHHAAAAAAVACRLLRVVRCFCAFQTVGVVMVGARGWRVHGGRAAVRTHARQCMHLA